jgi:hypothetical protein
MVATITIQKKLEVIEIKHSLNVKLPAGGMNCVKFAKEKSDIFFQDKNALSRLRINQH